MYQEKIEDFENSASFISKTFFDQESIPNAGQQQKIISLKNKNQLSWVFYVTGEIGTTTFSLEEQGLGFFSTTVPLENQDCSLSSTELAQETENNFNAKNIVQRVLPTHEKILQIKKVMRLNIVDMAAILKVSRPTVYKWFDESKENTIKFNKSNQHKINQIYEVCRIWDELHLHHLGSYLYKPMGSEHRSLFDLLKPSILDQQQIAESLKNIAKLILVKKQKNAQDAALLKKHGFKPISREDREDRLHDLSFL